MTLDDAATCLNALGTPVRLCIFRLLVKAGDRGLVVGDIQRHLDIPPSTLSHHIAALVQAGLVQQTRQGRALICTAEYQQMHDTVAFLTAECCMGVVLQNKAS